MAFGRVCRGGRRSALGVGFAGAKDPSLQDKIDAARSDAGQLSSKVDSQTAQIASLTAQAHAAGARAMVLNAQVENAAGAIGPARQAARRRPAAARSAAGEYADAVKQLDRRLVAIYESDAPDYVTVLLNSNGFDDLSTRADYLNALHDADMRIANRVASLRDQMAQHTHQVADLKQESDAQAQQLSADKASFLASEQAANQSATAVAAARSGTQASSRTPRARSPTSSSRSKPSGRPSARVPALPLGFVLLLERRDLPLSVGEGGLRAGPRGGHCVRAPVGGLFARQEARFVRTELLRLRIGLLLQIRDLVGVLGHLVAQRGDTVGDPHIRIVKRIQIVRARGEIVEAVRVEEHRDVVRRVAFVDCDQPLVELLDRVRVLTPELVELALGGVELPGELARSSLRVQDLGVEHHGSRAGGVGLSGQRRDLSGLRVDLARELAGVRAGRIDLVLERRVLGAGEADPERRRDASRADQPERHAAAPESARPDSGPAGVCLRCRHLLLCLRG